MGWDVPFVGHQSLGSGEVGNLLEKPSNWDKVYVVGYRQCSFGANGKLPDRTQDFVDHARSKISFADTSLWWVVSAVDAINLIAAAVAKTGGTDPKEIIGYWNGLQRYPGLFANYSFTPDEHNGFPATSW